MKLSHLANHELLSQMAKLARQEREILVKVLWHLREIDNRKLYSDLKCGSLFDYCVKTLKYSEGQASRRVKACRLLKQLPEIVQKIECGDLNLTQLNQVESHFNEEGVTSKNEKLKIIDLVAGKSTRETEKMLWELKEDDAPKMTSIKLKQNTVDSLRKLQGRHAHACPSMDVLIVKMIHEVEKLWDPGLIHKKSRKTNECSRYVPVSVRAEIWKRDRGVCRNCGSVYALEIDHVHPFAKGGKTSVDNLQLLCRNCNQRKAFVDYPLRKASTAR